MKRVMSLYLLFGLIFFQVLVASGQPIVFKKTDKWHGFEREQFGFENREAWIVKPAKSLEGKPWIWKAYFPDWHTDIDSILLSRGFHLAYLETNDMFGSPVAMQLWNRFHNWMTANGFAEKVALEGISRGGLYVYNWAKRNPLKVSCIYAEAPVCHTSSWPGGKGTSKGSPKDWQLLMEHMNMSDSQLVASFDDPMDNLEGLASAKVPVLHSIGLNDRIVPNEENSFLLIEKYIRLGGIATIMPMTKGVQQLEGHHFPIEQPDKIADFIFSNSYPVKKILLPSLFHNNRSGLENSFNRFTKEKKGRVAFMGGSITEGKGWRELVCQYLKEKFSETDFEFINAGISSTGSTPGAFRLGVDVLSRGQIDLFFEEAAVNDRTNGFPNQAQIRGMEGIIRHMRLANPQADIVMMHCVDPDKINDYRNGNVPLEIRNHETIAERYRVNSIHWAREVTQRIDAAEFTWNEDFVNLHPSPFGQQVYVRSLRAFLDAAFEQAKGKQTKDHALPAIIDPFSYAGGDYVEVSRAKLFNGWRLDPKWKPNDGLETRKQYVNIPAVIAETPGSKLDFEFTGTAVGICIASGPDAGKIQYSIDGKPFQTADLYTKWSSSLHLPWYIMLDDELKRKKHKLTIVISSDKNEKSKGNTCRILHFLVNF
ncbi:MAG: GDSL-type esterase/lipase family protein [Sphingobacteriales bacterium]|jgi:sialidase-1